jgi:hypothetical protein
MGVVAQKNRPVVGFTGKPFRSTVRTYLARLADVTEQL